MLESCFQSLFGVNFKFAIFKTSRPNLHMIFSLCLPEQRIYVLIGGGTGGNLRFFVSLYLCMYIIECHTFPKPLDYCIIH